ncbi:MAG TPA: Wzz/FepE/Etk N-terminal domain-containing protein [Rhodanobacter sp.]|nr:Wzz/FepE/Etk N-terminal domain-containing protein [Rhodanobacter sp.]
MRSSLPGHDGHGVAIALDASYASGESAYVARNSRYELSFANVFAMLWRRKWMFAICFALMFGFGVFVILHLKPLYMSEALVIIDPRQLHITNLQSVQEESSVIQADLNFVRSEMQILDSDEIALHVVQKLHLDHGADFGEGMLASHGWLTDLLGRLGLRQTKAPPLSPEARTAAAVASYMTRFSSFNDARSFIISVSFSARDPLLAQQILATHLQTYLEGQRAAKQLVVHKAEIWFETELKKLSSQVLSAEARLRQFRAENRLLQSGGQTVADRQLTAVTAQLTDARADYARKMARYRQLHVLSGQSGDREVADTPLQGSALLQRLQEDEAVAAQAVGTLESHYGARHPQVTAARNGLAMAASRVTTERERLVASARQDAVIAKANVEDLEHTQDALEQQLGTMSVAELTASQIARETDADRRLYDDLLARSKQVAVQRETQEADARLVSGASLPLRPIFPRTGILSLIAATAAALLSGALVVAFDLLKSQKFTTLTEVERYGGLPGLAIVPRVRLGRREHQPRLAFRSPLAASLQTLRNSIFFRCQAEGPHVIVFTSAMVNDGKSFVSVLFAQSVAANGKRVLLIDADLRRGSLTRRLGIAGHTGLASALRGTALSACIVRDVEESYDALPCDAGRKSAEALLGVDRIRAVLAEARGLYDVVVIDTPPLAAVDDALSFAAVADATVLVIRWANTQLTIVEAALRRLRLANAHVVGAVLNAAKPSGSPARDLEAYRLLSFYSDQGL